MMSFNGLPEEIWSIIIKKNIDGLDKVDKWLKWRSVCKFLNKLADSEILLSNTFNLYIGFGLTDLHQDDKTILNFYVNNHDAKYKKIPFDNFRCYGLCFKEKEYSIFEIIKLLNACVIERKYLTINGCFISGGESFLEYSTVVINVCDIFRDNLYSGIYINLFDTYHCINKEDYLFNKYRYLELIKAFVGLIHADLLIKHFYQKSFNKIRKCVENIRRLDGYELLCSQHINFSSIMDDLYNGMVRGSWTIENNLHKRYSRKLYISLFTSVKTSMLHNMINHKIDYYRSQIDALNRIIRLSEEYGLDSKFMNNCNLYMVKLIKKIENVKTNYQYSDEYNELLRELDVWHKIVEKYLTNDKRYCECVSVSPHQDLCDYCYEHELDISSEEYEEF